MRPPCAPPVVNHRQISRCAGPGDQGASICYRGRAGFMHKLVRKHAVEAVLIERTPMNQQGANSTSRPGHYVNPTFGHARATFSYDPRATAQASLSASNVHACCGSPSVSIW